MSGDRIWPIGWSKSASLKHGKIRVKKEDKTQQKSEVVPLISAAFYKGFLEITTAVCEPKQEVDPVRMSRDS